MNDLENLIADNRLLKNLADKAAGELVRVKASRAIAQKEVLEQGLIINSNNKVMRDLRIIGEDLSKLVNSQKDDIHELTAALTSSQLEALAKGKYIDEHMKPLKEDKKKAELIMSRLVELLRDPAITIWCRTEVLDVISTITEEVNNEN